MKLLQPIRLRSSILPDAARSWGRDEILKRLLRNASYIFSGKATAALIGLVALALMARSLGPSLLGMLAMVLAYTRLVDRLVRLEPWQAVVKYGAEALEQGRDEGFQRLVKLATLMDLGGALLAVATAAAGARVAGDLLGWSEQMVDMATVLSLGLAFHLVATPTGVLRLFDRFGVLALTQVAVAIVNLLLVAAAFLGGAGIWVFLLIVMLCQILEALVPFAIAWRELNRRGHAVGVLRRPLRGVTQEFTGIWGFIWSSNVSLLFRKSTYQLDTLIVGGVIDPTAAGLYNIAKRLGDAILKLGTPIQQAIYPDVARLWTRGEIARFRKMILHINCATGTLSSVALVLAALNVHFLITVTVGKDFLDAANLIVLQMLAGTIFLFGISLRPALFSMGEYQKVLKITVAATIAFFIWLVGSISVLGVVGATLAHVVFNAVWVCTALLALLRGTARDTQSFPACGKETATASSAPSPPHRGDVRRQQLDVPDEGA